MRAARRKETMPLRSERGADADTSGVSRRNIRHSGRFSRGGHSTPAILSSESHACPIGINLL